MNFRFRHILLYFFGFFILFSCAQIATITGGSEDKMPPSLIVEKSFPANKSIHFNSQEIILTFDEFFTVTNPNQNIFISHSLKNEPIYKTKGKTLYINLNNQLKKNTTYTINFGDAIKDYHAGNVLVNFTYVFSTGDFLDSMQIKGKLIDVKNSKPIENGLVLLYDTIFDSVVSLQKPVYFTKTNKTGGFTINNIKANTYKIFALVDENRNYLFDLPNEKIAFQKELIMLDSVVPDITLYLFEEDYIKQGVKSKKYEYPGKLTIELKKQAKTITTGLMDSTIMVFKQRISPTKDAIILWLNQPTNNTFLIKVTADTVVDTLKIYPFKSTKDTAFKLLLWDKQTAFNKAVSLTFNTPIKQIDTSLIAVYKDSASIPFTVKTDSLYPSVVFLDFKKNYEENYTYTLLPNAIKNNYKQTNTDTLTRKVTVYEKDFFGTLTINLKNTDSNFYYTLQLINNEKIVKEQQALANFITFGEIIPGNYQLHLLIDENKNGKWDTGNYYNQLQPEKIISFGKKIEVRSNWEMKEIWELR